MAKPSDGLGLLMMAGKKPSAEGAEDGGDEQELAAKALIKAIGGKSPSAVVDAFKQLMECCDDDYETDMLEDDDE